MKTTTPKAISRRDKLVDSMAKKLANGGNVEKKVITIHRKRRIKPMKYVYIGIALSVVSTSITWLVMTGKVAPGLVAPKVEAVPPEKNALDLLEEDLAAKKFGPDQYALHIRNCLICYDSLPACYKISHRGVNSDELFRSLYKIWPQLSLRTRAQLIQKMPYLERKWEKFRVEQQ